jgi:hypothetical protein
MSGLAQPAHAPLLAGTTVLVREASLAVNRSRSVWVIWEGRQLPGLLASEGNEL